MSRHGHLVFGSGAGGGSASGVMRGGSVAAVPGGSSHLAPLSSLPAPCSLAELMEMGSMPGRRFSDGLSSLNDYCSRRTSAEVARPRGSAEMTRSRGSAEIARSLMSLAAAEDAASGHHSGLKVAKLALQPGGPEAASGHHSRSNAAKLALQPGGPEAASGSDDCGGASDMNATSRGDDDRTTPTGSGRRRSIGSRPVPAGVAMLQQGLRIREDSLEIIAQPSTVVDEDGGRAGASAEIVVCDEGGGNSSLPPLTLTDAPPAAAPSALGRDGTGIISHEGLRVSLHQSQGNIAVRGGSVQHHPSSQQLEASPSSAAMTAIPSRFVGAAAATSSTHPPPPAETVATTAAPVLDDWMYEWGAAAAAGEEEREPTEAVPPPPAAAALRGDVGGAPAGVAAKLSASSKVNRGSMWCRCTEDKDNTFPHHLVFPLHPHSLITVPPPMHPAEPSVRAACPMSCQWGRRAVKPTLNRPVALFPYSNPSPERSAQAACPMSSHWEGSKAATPTLRYMRSRGRLGA